jgi:hypothetical protein
MECGRGVWLGNGSWLGLGRGLSAVRLTWTTSVPCSGVFVLDLDYFLKLLPESEIYRLLGLQRALSTLRPGF